MRNEHSNLSPRDPGSAVDGPRVTAQDESIARAASELVWVRSDFGRPAVEAVFKEAKNRVVQFCLDCGRATQHRDGMCLECGCLALNDRRKGGGTRQ